MTFYVYFTGTRNGRWIEAAGMRDAKWIFALQEGLQSIARISATRKGPNL